MLTDTPASYHGIRNTPKTLPTHAYLISVEQVPIGVYAKCENHRHWQPLSELSPHTHDNYERGLSIKQVARHGGRALAATGLLRAPYQNSPGAGHLVQVKKPSQVQLPHFTSTTASQHKNSKTLQNEDDAGS
ncbi:hypothetical protein PG984_015681 [Apiospora sp. TS-2023a]